jgi:uroporphyrinogen decarboxylase
MTPRERVFAALRGDPVDRPPVSFWGHVYHRESTARDLVDATVELQRIYGWDWVKLNPRRQYHAEPWGVHWNYSGREHEKPVPAARPIRQPSDFARVPPRRYDQGALAEQIEAVGLLTAALPPDVPFIETVFSPLAILGEMVNAPTDLRRAIDEEPDAVRSALEVVTLSFEPFVRAVLDAGADGIFLATVDWASEDLLSPAEYDVWARPFDLRLLAAAARAPFNVLHVCKGHNLLLHLADYPVAAFSWAATDPTNPSLETALARVPGAVMGGISQDGALLAADTEPVLEEYRRALDQTGGRRWLVAPGCSIPPTTPVANLRAVRDAVASTRAPTFRM